MNGMMYSGTPHSSIFTKIKEDMGIMEPMDKSNSPHIIKVPTPMATIPRSGASFARAPRLWDFTKIWRGVKKVNTSNRMTKTINVKEALCERNRIR